MASGVLNIYEVLDMENASARPGNTRMPDLRSTICACLWPEDCQRQHYDRVSYSQTFDVRRLATKVVVKACVAGTLPATAHHLLLGQVLLDEDTTVVWILGWPCRGQSMAVEAVRQQIACSFRRHR
jgi:hypothetical protein